MVVSRGCVFFCAQCFSGGFPFETKRNTRQSQRRWVFLESTSLCGSKRKSFARAQSVFGWVSLCNQKGKPLRVRDDGSFWTQVVLFGENRWGSVLRDVRETQKWTPRPGAPLPSTSAQAQASTRSAARRSSGAGGVWGIPFKGNRWMDGFLLGPSLDSRLSTSQFVWVPV